MIMSNKKTNHMNETIAGEIVDIPITNVIKENYMPYTMSVIISRALPEIDGFKPSHRKILYTMYLKNLYPNKPRTKSANVAGASMEFNPHSDASNYETMVRLSRDNESLLIPYIDNKGNMGKHHFRDMQFAASRYTEVRLTPIYVELFNDLSKNAIDMIDNYDNTKKEPSLLPVTFPSILVNANLGIAVGMASNICSFNLGEVCDLTCAYIKNKKINVSDYLKGPDFATGGILLYDNDEMNKIYETGFGSLRVRGKYDIDKKQRHILIKEIPYSTTAEIIIEDIIKYVSMNKIQGVKDVRDESDKDGLCIAIDYKKDADPEMIMQSVFHYTHLEDTFGCNFNIIINGHPRVLGIKDILNEWISWRRSCVKRTIEYDLNKAQSNLHLLKGLEKVLLNIDKVIKIIKNTEKDKDVIPNLMSNFKLDEIQATYIADMKLRNINKEYFLNKVKNIQNLEAEIKKLNTLLNSETRLNTYIIKQLENVKNKYNQPRRTQIVEAKKLKKFNNEIEKLEDYDVHIIVTNHGYIKKIPLSSFKENTDIKLKENDFIINEINCKNSTEVIVFTNKCIAYKIRGNELSDCSISDFGEYIPSYCEFDINESIMNIVITSDFKNDLLFVFENGKVVKIPLSAYITKTKRKKLINAFNSNSKIISIFELSKDENIILKTNDDKAIIFNSHLINSKTTKSSQGTQTIRLNKNLVVSANIFDKTKFKFKTPTINKLIAKNIPFSGKKI